MPNEFEPLPPRGYLGTVARGYIGQLTKMGILAQVREACGPAGKALIDKPPLPITWLQTAACDDLTQAVEKVAGLDGIKQMSLGSVRESLGSILRPVIAGVVALFGDGPHTLFENYQSAASMMTRGARFLYTPGEGTAGVVEVQHAEPCGLFVYASWEGALSYAFDIAKVDGTAARAQLIDGGRAARIGMLWKAKGERSAA